MSLEDIKHGLNVVRTLLKLRRFQQAADTLVGDLSNALEFNLEAYVEMLSLHQPFFPGGWDQLEQGNWELATATFAEAVRMAREAVSPTRNPKPAWPWPNTI